MNILISEEFLKNIKGLKRLNDVPFKGSRTITSDSREIKKGELFIAFSGEKYDGHMFIEMAIKKGIAGIIGERKKLKNFSNLSVPVFGCNNSIDMYGAIATEYRKRLQAKFVALTGSAGKTTVKELIKYFAKGEFNVTATEANNNNHIGVPKTILSASINDALVVAECGTNHFGEIKYTAKIVQPDIALITNIGDSHLEYLINRDGVLQEKRALLDICSERNGLVLINMDDIKLRGIKKEFKNVRTVSIRKKADYTLVELRTEKNGKRILQVNSPFGSFPLVSSLPGTHALTNILLAVAAALEVGVQVSTIQQQLLEYKAPKGRLFTEMTESGIFLFDDTYNANPDSMRAAIEVLKQGKQQRKLLILGDMFELGEYSAKAHRQLANHIAEGDFTSVLLTGEMMVHLYTVLKRKNIAAQFFETKEKLVASLQGKRLKNYAILVKGSRGMRMETIADFLRNLKEM